MFRIAIAAFAALMCASAGALAQNKANVTPVADKVAAATKPALTPFEGAWTGGIGGSREAKDQRIFTVQGESCTWGLTGVSPATCRFSGNVVEVTTSAASKVTLTLAGSSLAGSFVTKGGKIYPMSMSRTAVPGAQPVAGVEPVAALRPFLGKWEGTRQISCNYNDGEATRTHTLHFQPSPKGSHLLLGRFQTGKTAICPLFGGIDWKNFDARLETGVLVFIGDTKRFEVTIIDQTSVRLRILWKGTKPSGAPWEPWDNLVLKRF